MRLPEPPSVAKPSPATIARMPPANSNPPVAVALRPVEPADLPRLFELQCDEESSKLAGVRPRPWDAFQAVWAKSLADPNVISRVILANGELAGSISRFRMAEGAGAGHDSVGYWIDRAWWGRGIATQALRLFVREVAARPLHAQVAAENAASLKVLARAGFVEVSRRFDPGSERYIAGVVVELILR